MNALSRLSSRLLLIALLACIAPMHARAQMGGQMGSQMGGHGGRRGGQQKDNTQQAPAPTPRAVAQPWPRLDPGAMLCASSDDLLRYQKKMADQSGTATTGSQPDCRRVAVVTPIKIVGHDGPSRTSVVATDTSKQTGWTNTYLPDKAPQ
jgi:hypothetical protein